MAGWSAASRSANRGKMAPQTYNLTLFLRKEWAQQSANLLMDTFGLYGQLEADSKYAKYDGSVGRRWESSRMIHAAGTPEILRLVIASRGLGLPRVPRQFNVQINEAISNL